MAQEALRELADSILMDFDLSTIFQEDQALQDAMGGVDLPPACMAAARCDDDSDLQATLGGCNVAPPRPHAVDAARIAAYPRRTASDLHEVLS